MPNPETITILAGGWSAAALDKKRLAGTVIGVNDAAYYAPCHIAVSMDRLWTEARWNFLCGRTLPAFIRSAALKGNDHRPDWLHVFECDYRRAIFSDDPRILNGTNSGFCALNKAYQMRPRRLFLAGFDMCRSPTGAAYWHPPYSWSIPAGATKDGKYAEWARQFSDAAAAFARVGTEVFNVSPGSAIDAFQKISASQYEDITR